MSTKKAIGRIGSWFAEVEGRSLPCIHKYWLKGLVYHDPFDRPAEATKHRKIAEYVDAIRMVGRVILTDDDATYGLNGKACGFSRTGYIAIFTVKEVSFNETDGLRLEIVDRLDSLI